MGGAQTLAATMAGASCLAIECQPSRIAMRLDTGYLDVEAKTLDEALDLVTNSRTPLSVGLCANAADIYPELVRRGVRPDLVTDPVSYTHLEARRRAVRHPPPRERRLRSTRSGRPRRAVCLLYTSRCV